ncbi:hypothetical protein BWI97_07190 [Siphonobacter sp. BAB-5405]|uniref:hypothetical protein n=1 Tax=Siphonobacter sp. BAB-5405 TaxID=1864825 RepID=UPI000C7F8DB7|nr:hypothetical protein [Siphonobacter sp. BAB-5405]PMD97407.1 hypothetical protein BWI97_07190 [Siphonobacter sp. BAB-5405]
MKKLFEKFVDDWEVYTGMSLVMVIILFICFLMVDCVGGKTITVTGQVLEHRYKPSWVEQTFENVPYDLGNGHTAYRMEYHTYHHSEQFSLVVLGPDGPESHSVNQALYVYYRDGQDVPIRRRIGAYSGRCLTSWISSR